MIFCICQLVEKAIEHDNTKMFLLCADLCIRPIILYLYGSHLTRSVIEASINRNYKTIANACYTATCIQDV